MARAEGRAYRDQRKEVYPTESTHQCLIFNARNARICICRRMCEKTHQPAMDCVGVCWMQRFARYVWRPEGQQLCNQNLKGEYWSDIVEKFAEYNTMVVVVVQVRVDRGHGCTV